MGTEGDLVEPQRDVQALISVVTRDPLNLLFLFVLPALAGDLLPDLFNFGALQIFVLNVLALLPLTKLLSFATEELALSIGRTLGVLLNVSLGNAVELIVATYALKKGLLGVVEASIVGGLLGNLLLCLGLSFFCGGLANSTQKFNAEKASDQSSLLLLAVFALVLPTVYLQIPGEKLLDELLISRLVAVILALVYVFYLVYLIFPDARAQEADPREEETEEPTISRGIAFALLAICFVAVAICSEDLVDGVEGLTKQLGWSEDFVGVILLPIVGSAAEQYTAVNSAIKNKPDITVGVALGGATQTALLLCPFTVLYSWANGIPFDLNFKLFNVSVLLLTVLIVANTIRDGRSNWLQGLLLLAAYLIAAITFWFY